MNLYFLNTGSTSWANPLNWSDTDGGAPIGLIPTIADNVYLTTLSGNISQDVGTGVTINNLNCTGYSRVLNMDVPNLNGSLTIGGNSIILSSQMKIIHRAFAAGSLSGTSFILLVDCSIATNGCIIPRLTITTNALTLTLLDTLNISTLLTIASRAIIFTGSYGFIIAGLLNDTGAAGVTQTLQAGNTYTIKGSFKHTSERGNLHGKWVSSTPGTKARFIVTGDTNIGFVDFTDIDASGGRTLYPFTGVVTNCLNITSMTDRILPPNATVASSRIS